MAIDREAEVGFEHRQRHATVHNAVIGFMPASMPSAVVL